MIEKVSKRDVACIRIQALKKLIKTIIILNNIRMKQYFVIDIPYCFDF